LLHLAELSADASFYKEEILTTQFLKDFYQNTNSLEYLAIFLRDYKKAKNKNCLEVTQLLSSKMNYWTLEELEIKLYFQDISRFIEFKKNNEGRVYLSVSHQKVEFLRKVIQIIYEGCINPIIQQLDQNLATSVSECICMRE